MRVLIVEDEPYRVEAVRDDLRLAAIAGGVAGDGETAECGVVSAEELLQRSSERADDTAPGTGP